MAGLTVATAGVPLLHVPPMAPLLLIMMVEPAHTEDAPFIVPALGSVLIAIVNDALEVPQLLVTL